jgi:purine-cytosine permease-like protein
MMALDKDAFELYEDGKHRRYSILFTVNGGAFAIAKLLTGESGRAGLGELSLSQLSLGMVLFTAVMVWDIFWFGQKMRDNYLRNDAFGIQGKIVLLLLGMLLCVGWSLVGLPGALFTCAIR